MSTIFDTDAVTAGLEPIVTARLRALVTTANLLVYGWHDSFVAPAAQIVGRRTFL